jgi:hypothetical protein
MDPQATLDIITDRDTSPADRIEAANNLAEWLERGGFMPGLTVSSLGGPSFGGNTAARNWVIKRLREMGAKRLAAIKGNGVTLKRVDTYLPGNYTVLGWDDDGDSVLIEGFDSAGWTLDDYVLPRLASGGMFGAEVTR